MIELLEGLLILQFVKVFSKVVMENMSVAFLFFWTFNMLAMFKSWVSFLLLNMLNWRILKVLVEVW